MIRNAIALLTLAFCFAATQPMTSGSSGNSSSVCTCPGLNFFQGVTSADAVLRVDLLSGPFDLSDTVRIYVGRVLEIFKVLPVTLSCNQLILIRTPQNASLCGLELFPGYPYLITGFWSDVMFDIEMFNVNLCGQSRLWCDLDQCSIDQLRSLPQEHHIRCPETRCNLTNSTSSGSGGNSMSSGSGSNSTIPTICSRCGNRMKGFQTENDACLEGYKVVDDMYCRGCEYPCSNLATSCFWGSPQCCQDGSLMCPSNIDSSTLQWTFDCQLCGSSGNSAPLPPEPVEGILTIQQLPNDQYYVMNPLSQTEKSDLQNVVQFWVSHLNETTPDMLQQFSSEVQL